MRDGHDKTNAGSAWRDFVAAFHRLSWWQAFGLGFAITLLVRISKLVADMLG